MENGAYILGRELDADPTHPTNLAQAMQGANQHEWNQAVANEDAALEGAGFEYDEIGNIVD